MIACTCIPAHASTDVQMCTLLWYLVAKKTGSYSAHFCYRCLHLLRVLLFTYNISQMRRKEVRLMAQAATIKTFNLSFVFAVPPVVFLLVTATYVFGGAQPLDAVFAFTVVSDLV